MLTRMVHHHNLIGHEINESLIYYKNDVFDREIYCRKKHMITEPKEKDCTYCPYYAGLELGHGHECLWEDVVDEQYNIPHDERYKEYERVDKLIKQGIIPEAKKDLIAGVKSLEYDENEWIYEQSADRRCRYLLGKRGKKTLVCCGVNPSVASPNDLDPTMRRVEYFAKENGYDSYIMINLYPMRATNPDDMHEVADMHAIEKNMEYIEEILSKGNCDICAAWGNLIKSRNYLKECLSKICEVAKKNNCVWYTFGELTKENNPRHPLYLSKECKMKEFNINEYL